MFYLFVCFNVQNNNLFSYKKNGIDHAYANIDQGLISIANNHFVDIKPVTVWSVGQKTGFIDTEVSAIG